MNTDKHLLSMKTRFTFFIEGLGVEKLSIASVEHEAVKQIWESLSDEERNQVKSFDCTDEEAIPSDGTAGHSKGEWYPSALCTIQATNRETSIATIGNPKERTASEEEWATCKLLTLAQHAPHDCSDPECPGVVNKRKLELYDKFQYAIKAFAEQGLLT